MKFWSSRRHLEIPIDTKFHRPPPPTIESKQDPALPSLGEHILGVDGVTLWILVGIDFDQAEHRGTEIRVTLHRLGDWREFDDRHE